MRIVAVRTPVPSGDPQWMLDLNTFDPSRGSKAHLAFGHGRHMCIGQHFARLELQVALAGMMRRFPSLRLAASAKDLRPDPPETAAHQALPVAW